MKMCDKYPEMISAYADGELSGIEKEELEAHLKTCAECRSALEAYRSISMEIAGDMEEPPEDFTEKVMGRVRSGARRKRTGRITRWAGAAACIALIVLAAPRLANLGCGSKSSMDTALPMSNGMGEQNAQTSESAAYDDADGCVAESGCEPGDALDMYNSMDGGSFKEEDVYSAEKYGANYSMVLIMYGKTPEELADSQYKKCENGELRWEVPTEQAEELAAVYECDAEVFDMTLVTALVIVVP